MAKRIYCPNIFCNSSDVVPITTKKKFSFGKAAVGGAVGSLINPLGTAVGVATGINGRRGKTKFMCQKCGKVFERKV